ncbi:MAG: hypothetical protein LUC93_04340 [Planctomycetaceae bacterium]|nr:hypothetical protein [Planctomycetaceae bacterium]
MNATSDNGNYVFHSLNVFTIPLLCVVAFGATLVPPAFARAGDTVEGRVGEDLLARQCALGIELSRRLQVNIDVVEQNLSHTGGIYSEIMAFRHAHAALLDLARALWNCLPKDAALRPIELETWLEAQLKRYTTLTDRCTLLTERLARAVLIQKAAGTEKQDTMAVLQVESVCDWLTEMTMELQITAAGLEVVYSNLLPTMGHTTSAQIVPIIDQAEKRMTSVAEQLHFRESTRDSMSEMIRTYPEAVGTVAERKPPLRNSEYLQEDKFQ